MAFAVIAIAVSLLVGEGLVVGVACALAVLFIVGVGFSFSVARAFSATFVVRVWFATCTIAMSLVMREGFAVSTT